MRRIPHELRFWFLPFVLIASLIPHAAGGSDASELPAGVAASIESLESLAGQAEATRSSGRVVPASLTLAATPGSSVLHLGELEAGRRVWSDEMLEESSGSPGRTETDWTPYAGPFDLDEAAFLLRRSMVGPRWHEMEEARLRGLAATLDTLLAPRAPLAPPGGWALDPVPDVSDWTPEQVDSLIVLYRERMEHVRLWWLRNIIQNPRASLTESMVHFWHDHFATGAEKVFFPQSMYIQNATFRQHALGNFRELTRAMVSDPAMLLWLDGQVNRTGSINENFARELLELFTMGLDQYEQDDVVAAARSLTGWITVDAVNSIFVPQYHDHGYKVFLGQGGYWFPDDVIDIIFQQDETARFLCRKLYRWFIDEYPDEALMEDLAQTLRSNDYEVEPVLRRLLGSEHFFDPEFRGSIMTDGLDHYGGRVRSLYLDDDLVLYNIYEGAHTTFMYFSMGVYGHYLLDPPNVAGWPGYRTWLNAYILPWRKKLDIGLVDGFIDSFNMEMQLDAMALVQMFQDPDDPYQLVDDTALYLFGMPPTPLVRQKMLDELLQGSDPGEWSLGIPEAEDRIRGLFKLAFRLPDSQLK